MAGDPFKKVQPGQRLEISAEAYNAFIDAARAARQQKVSGAEASQFFRQSGIVKVQNTTGSAQNRFAVLGLGAPIILPADNLGEFQRQVTCRGVQPAQHGPFCVLLEPLAAGAIGQAVVSGVAPVRLLVTSQLYDYAEAIEGDTGKLRNVPHGPSRVLWVEPAGDEVRWAIVRIDDGNYETHVLITSDEPDAEGYYSGQVQRYDAATGTWENLFPCKVVDVNP